MSIATRLEDGTREVCIRAWGAAQRAGAVARRAEGQTATEYMGLLLLIALIIAALVTLQVPQKIANAISDLIDRISTGQSPQGQPGASPTPTPDNR
jgi:hypothetical protein